MILRSFFHCSSTKTADSVTWNVIHNGEKPREAGLVKIIYDVISIAINKPRCGECFEAVDATPIIKQDGLVFVTESVFTNSEFDSQWTLNKTIADGMREKFDGTKSLFLGNTTAADVSAVGSYSGKRYIGITSSGLREEIDHLSVTIIHSLLHSGGKEGRSGFHDLVYLGKKYDDVIEACQNNKSRVKKAAGFGENEQ